MTDTERSAAELSTELRYLALVRMASSLAAAADWEHIAAAVSSGLGGLESSSPVRLWGRTSDGFQELTRWPATNPFRSLTPRALREASESEEPRVADYEDNRLLAGLHAGGVSLGVLEVDDPAADAALMSDAGPMVACSVGLLAAEGVGPVLLPLVGSTDGTASVMAAFAAEAKRLLQHDRLSAYLLTDDGRAFERFAVATSPIIAGEGVIIPFHEVGLRHVVASNRPLVSNDLGSDPRIVGREDRVIAGAGFHGLLSVPLRLHGRPVGVLNFVSRTPGFYCEEDLPTAERIADQVGVFVDNLRRQRRLRAVIRQEATDRERERLTRDVYHAVAHAVTDISRLALQLRDRFEGQNRSAAERLQRIVDLATVELGEVRRAVVDASPRALDAHTLSEVIDSTVRRFGRDTGVQTSWTLHGDPTHLPGGTTRAVFRVLQEALLNVRQHAAATKLEVELVADDTLVLAIHDDGVGFDAAVVEQPSAGLGLHGMRERASALGGSVSVETTPGGGTTVTMLVPGAFDRHGRPAEPGETLNDDGHGMVRVLVVHGEPLSAAGLGAILDEAGGIRNLGHAPSMKDAQQDLERLRPDVVLVSAGTLHGDPDTALEDARGTSPGSRVLVVAGMRDAWPARLIDAGVDGCIAEGPSLAELPDAIRAVADGAKVFVRGDQSREDAAPAVLTPRELEVLALVAVGHTNDEIGKSLFLATKTVERQVATTAAKLGAKNRAHAAALAVARGLVGP